MRGSDGVVGEAGWGRVLEMKSGIEWAALGQGRSLARVRFRADGQLSGQSVRMIKCWAEIANNPHSTR